MKKFLFADLDDTLFSSVAKCRSEHELMPAAYLKDGTACSFTTAKQRALFALFAETMTVIPTTARNCDALARVDLPFSDYKITNYGGIVLTPEGEPDAAWLASMRDAMSQSLAGLTAIAEKIDQFTQSTDPKGRARLIADFGIPFYVVVKDPAKIVSNLVTIEREVVLPWVASEGKDFYIHRNGNNLAILPASLNKARAVKYVTRILQERYGEILTFGMGDSKSDARFMAACDYAMVPNGSQLADMTMGVL